MFKSKNCYICSNGSHWKSTFSVFGEKCLISVSCGHDFLMTTQITRLGTPFRYNEHVHKVARKFLEVFEKKVSTRNIRFCRNIPTWFWASFFNIWTFALFLTYDLIGVLCGHYTFNLVLCQRYRSNRTFR